MVKQHKHLNMKKCSLYRQWTWKAECSHTPLSGQSMI